MEVRILSGIPKVSTGVIGEKIAGGSQHVHAMGFNWRVSTNALQLFRWKIYTKKRDLPHM
jgi:hypothetical protein